MTKPVMIDTVVNSIFQHLKKLNKAGILVVGSTGNNHYDKALIMPACLSNVLAVGALAAVDDPYIAAYSNHSPLVDILAPGSEIRSAFLVNDTGDVKENALVLIDHL